MKIKYLDMIYQRITEKRTTDCDILRIMSPLWLRANMLGQLVGKSSTEDNCI